MPKKGHIKKKERPAKWSIDQLKVSGDPSGDRTVQWECPDDHTCEFVVWFPSNSNPLDGSNEVYSNNGIAEAAVKPYDGKVIAKGKKFYYCILLLSAGNEDVVVGSSPPTMIIE